MKRKYEFTGETRDYCGITLKRIKRISDGEIGGWIEKEENLSHEGDCWISGDAKVFGNAQIFDNAKVSGKVEICGESNVYENAGIYDDALIYGKATVVGHAKVFGSARVFGHAMVAGDAKVFGNVQIFGGAKISGKAEIFGIVGESSDKVVVASSEDQPDVPRADSMLSVKEYEVMSCGTTFVIKADSFENFNGLRFERGGETVAWFDSWEWMQKTGE